MATRTYKYRIYPNHEQEEKLSFFFGCARKMYNLSLAWWMDEYAKSRESGEPMGRMPDYTFYKKQDEYAYLKDCDSVALQQARIHLQKAIDDFLKSKGGARNGKRLGFPRFKRKGVSKDSYTTYNNTNCVKISDDGRFITIPKLGKVRIRLHRCFAGVIKSVSVSRSRAMNHYVSLTVETGEPCKPLVNRIERRDKLSVVGLDMSLQGLVVSSDTADETKTKFVRQYRKHEKKLARLQRQVSRKQMVGTGKYRTDKHGKRVEIKERSKNREKARIRHAKYAERVANMRTDFLTKEALYYARKYDVVVIEDLDMQAMSKCLKLGKSVHDVAFGEFRRWLEWEGMKYDCHIHVVDKWFASSKTCSSCGYKKKDLALKDREWVCPECGTVHDRDFNAAVNLREEFVRQYNTAGTAGINACGDGTSTLRDYLARVLPQNRGSGRKQEASDCESGPSDARDFSRG